MKLLFLIHRLPCPADGGAKLRAAAELHWLAARHDVWCAGMLDGPRRDQSAEQVEEALASLGAMCRDVAAVPLRRLVACGRAAAGVLSGQTLTETYFASPNLETTVLRWAEIVDFDAVLAFSSSMAELALRVPARRHILNFDDFDSFKWAACAKQARGPKRWLYEREARRLGRREVNWLRRFDAGVVVNEKERSLVADAPLREKVHVIEAATPGILQATEDEPSAYGRLAATLTHEPRVSFIGAMDYEPNVTGAMWFGDAVWPLVRRKHQQAEWWLVGKSPSRAVRRLHNGEDVHVTGTVPEIGPYLAQTRVMVAPLRVARGVQIKVLMAMAAGKPCVVTSEVAAGIGAEAGRELYVADTPEAFARAVVTLLEDDDRAVALGRAGRRFVTHRFCPERGMKRLEALLLGQPDKEVPELVIEKASCHLVAAPEGGL